MTAQSPSQVCHPASQAGSDRRCPRQPAHRSSTFHSMPGIFRVTSRFTGSVFEITRAQVGCQISTL